MDYVLRQGRRIAVGTLYPTAADLKAEREAKKSRKATAAESGGPFVRYPIELAYQVGAAKNAGAAKLFPILMYLAWQAHGRPFKLANSVLQGLGIDRHRKGAVLRELEQMGLIKAEHQPRKSPLITVVASQKQGGSK